MEENRKWRSLRWFLPAGCKTVGPSRPAGWRCLGDRRPWREGDASKLLRPFMSPCGVYQIMAYKGRSGTNLKSSSVSWIMFWMKWICREVRGAAPACPTTSAIFWEREEDTAADRAGPEGTDGAVRNHKSFVYQTFYQHTKRNSVFSLTSRNGTVLYHAVTVRLDQMVHRGYNHLQTAQRVSYTEQEMTTSISLEQILNCSFKQCSSQICGYSLKPDVCSGSDRLWAQCFHNAGWQWGH